MFTLALATALALQTSARCQSLEQELARESIAHLVQDSLAAGNPPQGAALFHQPYLACTKCHTAGEDESGKPLGPDLARIGERLAQHRRSATEPPAQIDKWRTDVAKHVITAILQPSAAILRGYEPAVLALRDGSTLTGLLVEERPDAIVVRLVDREDKPTTIARASIEKWSKGRESIMPTGLVNQLANRRQFLDLVAYLIDIGTGGPQRALELRPNVSQFNAPLPEYESHIDHAGLISAWNTESFARGEAIYQRVCANCHGTHDRTGSLPTSLRFTSGRFKNGSDPWAIYQTLTRGYGLMAQQTWMAPRQKYDVIFYIREAFLASHNRSQYVVVDKSYLQKLPKGDTFGPTPTEIELWSAMDYGDHFINTYETGRDGTNFAYKGIAIRLDAGAGGVSHGRHWIVFDHDTLRLAAAWSRPNDASSGFIDWNGVQFNGKHEVHPRVVGKVQVANANGPGWANPQTGSFEDLRMRGRDGRRYGPLPRDWARFRGLHVHGRQTVLHYLIGDADVLELFDCDSPNDQLDAAVFSRTLDIGPSDHDLVLRVAPAHVAVRIAGSSGASLAREENQVRLYVPASATPLVVKLLMAAKSDALLRPVEQTSLAPKSLRSLLDGGPPRWPQIMGTQPIIGRDDGPFAVDVLTHPADNPWHAQMRLTALDFLPDGDRAAVASWDGDVWIVSGLRQIENGLRWQRIASGLFQPLGLKVVGERIHVACRDQIVMLHDCNGDGETDFYENFNNDHQVTEHFHEFAMGLQTDDVGNFYYAKSARHALPAIVPQHGTLLRVSRDGSRTEIVANGFRAANGVCLNRDGTFFVTDQEGHWNPKNRINWVRPGRFYGNMFGYHEVKDPSDAAMEQPLCWITNSFDRSPAELLWVDSPKWGPLRGTLLNFSYGYGKVFVVPHEQIGERMQGGMCELPIAAFPTGIMRGRFSPYDGHLYTCGMFAWAGSVTQPGGFYRIRYTGKPLHVPIKLAAREREVAITFSRELDAASANDVSRFAVKTWSLRRSAKYGSDHFNEQPMPVQNAQLSSDRRTIVIALPELRPTWCMEIKYRVKSADGMPVAGVIHNTIHALAD